MSKYGHKVSQTWHQSHKESSGVKWESSCSICACFSQGFLFKLPHHFSGDQVGWMRLWPVNVNLRYLGRQMCPLPGLAQVDEFDRPVKSEEQWKNQVECSLCSKAFKIMSMIGVETPHHHAFCSFSVYYIYFLQRSYLINLYLCGPVKYDGAT